MLSLLVLACTAEDNKLQSSNILSSETAIFTSVSMDYSVGSLSSITTDSLTITEDISSVSGDPVIRYDGEALWQLNRYQYDTIRQYDPRNLRYPLLEISVAPETGSSNPHDVARCNQQLFVSLYEQSHLLILNPENLDEITTIDISAFADDDGRTEASSLVVLQNKLYLGLQGLNRNNGYSYVDSTILEIDCLENQVVNSWNFGANIQLHDWKEDQLLISTYQAENFDAGLYSFHPENETFETVLQTEDNISAVSVLGEQIAFLSASSSFDSYQINCFDGEAWYTHTDFLEYLSDIQINQAGEIWATAHWGWINPSEAKSGIYRFDSRCQELTPNLLALNLAPNSLVFVTP